MDRRLIIIGVTLIVTLVAMCFPPTYAKAEKDAKLTNVKPTLKPTLKPMKNHPFVHKH